MLENIAMKRITKLTPQVLKRIISEERAKLQKAQDKKEDNDLLNELKAIKALIKIRKHQQKKLSEFKKLHEIRKKLKKSLIKRL